MERTIDLRGILKDSYGPDAEFREGQEDAIKAVLNGEKELVVQKTGWGKSLVYFLATRAIRQTSGKFTIIISPLLALMNNQIEAADRLGLNVQTINSQNLKEWDSVCLSLASGNVDALIISPERLANQEYADFMNRHHLYEKIGLFVVDEAHCISDWGHDFRPDYKRIVNLLKLIPPTVPILATTATANDRVVKDIQEQLGENLKIVRGSLTRENLAIQVIRLDTVEERLVWLSDHIPELPGSGIVYCSTIRDCELVSDWLQKNKINAKMYTSRSGDERGQIEQDFYNNRIKVLVATVALGMGYDKPDISFVIHFRKPQNLIAYYQQIGRAGRNLDKAYAVLLYGEGDDNINQYFIESAHPSQEALKSVIDELTSASSGLSYSKLLDCLDLKDSRLKQCLKILQIQQDVSVNNHVYYKTPRPWNPDTAESEDVKKARYQELKELEDFLRTDRCYMHVIAEALDDDTAGDCGICANCKGRNLFDSQVPEEAVERTAAWVRSRKCTISPRAKWPFPVEGESSIAAGNRCQEGIALSRYGDAGWGKMIQYDKYSSAQKKEECRFRRELVDAAVERLRPFVLENQIKWVTNVSSVNRPYLVKEFAEQVAEGLGLIYRDVIRKTPAPQQKEFNNSSHQCKNAMDSFDVLESEILPGKNVLLIDDMVDSKWTFTVLAYKLTKAGTGKVFPFALADSSNG